MSSTRNKRRSQWPRGVRRGSTAASLLGFWVRIPPGAWMSVCVVCCVLSDRGLCDGLTTRPEESYRMWCVVVCDLETSRMRRPWPALGRSATKETRNIYSKTCLKRNAIVPVYRGPGLGRFHCITSRCVLCDAELHVSRVCLQCVVLRCVIYLWVKVARVYVSSLD